MERMSTMTCLGLPSGLASISPSLSSCSMYLREEKPDPSCAQSQESSSGPFAACPLPWEPPCSLPCFMQPPGLLPLLVPHS